DQPGPGRPGLARRRRPDGHPGQHDHLWFGGGCLMSEPYLPAGLPIPVPERNGLSKPFWEGLRAEVLKVQRNPRTGVYQFPPQWITFDDQSFDVEWIEVAPRGVIYSWTRVWHPVHPALKDHGPYIVVVVDLPHAGNVR